MSGEILYRISPKCKGFRLRRRGRRSPVAQNPLSGARRSRRARHVAAAGIGPLPLPPVSCVVHSRRGRRLNRPDKGNLNPRSSCGHFVQGVTRPFLSSCIRLTRDRSKRCVRSGAAASPRRMQPFTGRAVCRIACGRRGVGLAQHRLIESIETPAVSQDTIPDRLPIGKLRCDGSHRMLSHIRKCPSSFPRFAQKLKSLEPHHRLQDRRLTTRFEREEPLLAYQQPDFADTAGLSAAWRVGSGPLSPPRQSSSTAGSR